MKRRTLIMNTGALGAVALAPLAAQSESDQVGTIPLTRRYQIDSEHVGDRFEITIAEPFPIIPGLPEPENCNILYALDAPFTGGAVIAVTRHNPSIPGFPVPHVLPPTIVVNIGYPIKTVSDFHEYITFKRNRDLVPPDEPVGEVIRALNEKEIVPRADQFLKFMEEELDPFVREQTSHAGPQKAALMGHSYGGLFATFAFEQQSSAFDHYLIFSPGFVEPQSPLLARIVNAQPDSFEGRVYMSMAQHEEAYTDTYGGNLGISFHKLAAALNPHRHSGLQIMTNVVPHETHGGIPYADMLPGMRWLFETPESQAAETLMQWASSRTRRPEHA